ncbi:MAG: diaminopimelate decarboxylase [Endomicrobiia bacterium]
MFVYKQNQLFCENVPVEEIATSVGTPVYIYSKNQIIKNLKDYDRAFNSVPHLICYAIKANTNKTILKTIFNCGAGADITSGGELYRSINAGAKPEKIVFAGLGKTEEEIRYAIKQKILIFNVESINELEKIDKIAYKIGKKVKIAIRINPNIDPHTHKYITTGKSENKFGIPIEDAINVFASAKKYKNILVSGIHCHIGSQITLLKPFLLMAQKISEIVKQLEKKKIILEYIDIGGGLGIKYKDEKPPTPEQLAKTVLPILRHLRKKLILEPGRYIVGNAGILVTKIIYCKKGKQKNFLVVDAGMNDLIRPTLYGAYHEIIPVKKKNTANLTVDVVGPICESGDYLGKNRILPWNSEGNFLTVMCAGAYGFTMSSNYNSRPRAAEVIVDKDNWQVIKTRQNYKDLIRGE